MVRALALALVALALVPAVGVRARDAAVHRARAGREARHPAGQVEFRFDEAVEASFGALRVFDSKGNEVQTGKAFHPDGKGAEIAVKLKPGLGDGTYTATYRVVSADGHPVSSGFVFTVGEAAAPAESLDQLLAGGGTGPVTNTALGVRARLPVRRDRARPRRADLLPRDLAPRPRHVAPLRRAAGADPARRRDRRLPLRVRRARAPGRRRRGLDVLGRRAAGHGREVLGTRFGRAWGLGALAWLIVLAALALRPLRGTPPSPVRLDRARGPAVRARAAARRSAATRACSRRSRSCCPRTSSTSSR